MHTTPIPHSVRGGQIARCALAAGTLFVVAGCNSVRTAAPRGANDQSPAPVGVPYHLPMGLITVNLEFPSVSTAATTGSAPTFGATVAHYPDPGATFVLSPDVNALFDTKHTIAVSNGLLTSVSTVEDGKAKDAILAVVDAGIDLAKLKSGRVFGAESGGTETADPFLNDSPSPTDAEIAYALSRVAGSKMSVQLKPGQGGLKSEPVAGAEQLLETQTDLAQADSPSALSFANGAPSANRENGVYTRSVSPYVGTVVLVLKGKGVQALRLLSYQRALQKLDQDDAELSVASARDDEELRLAVESYNLWSSRTAAFEKQVFEIHSRLAEPSISNDVRSTLGGIRDALKAALQDAETARGKAEGQRTTVQGRTNSNRATAAANKAKRKQYQDVVTRYQATPPAVPDTVLRRFATVAALPDMQSLVRIPITRAPIGKTTNTVTFENGILTKYESDRPSTVNVICGIPVAITSKVINAVTQIIKFRVDVNTEKAKAADSDLALAKKLKEVSDELEKLKKTPPPAANPADPAKGQAAAGPSPAGDESTTSVAAGAPRKGEEQFAETPAPKS